MKPELAVVIHDVAATTWPACERLLRCVREVAPVRATLLVVPRYHGAAEDPAFIDWLGAARAGGDELALHGYTHLDPLQPDGWLDHAWRRCYTAGEGEFSALSCAQATARLRAGQDWFAARGWSAPGFVAPAWLMSEGTWQAFAEVPFEYTCTLTRLVALKNRAGMRSRSIVYSTRSAWRRVLSHRWAAAVAWRERSNPLLRFELHPPDAVFSATRRSWRGLLERALKEREAVTLQTPARRLAAQPALAAA